jgi:predicted nuclease with TOPRIM domain
MKPRNSIMENPVIQTELAELIKKLDGRFDRLDNRLDKIDDRLGKLEVGQARLEEKFDAQEKIVTELKDSQNKQIWALIILAFTAVVSLVIGLGKFIFFPNP